jgi:hypothetical protein
MVRRDGLGSRDLRVREEESPGSPGGTDQDRRRVKAEADKQINEQNAAQELSKLEQEVSADANQP